MKKDWLRIQAHIIFGFLIIEYLLGMVASLFVQFPNTANKKLLWEFAQGQWSIVLHILIAFGLVISGIAFLFRTIRRKNKYWIISASVGLASLLVATFAGMEFVSTQNDAASYTMATAFIVALVSYGWGIYRAK